MATHTLYGQILGEIGLVGAVAFLAVLACFALNGRDVARCYRGVPWNERGFPFWLAIGILVSVVLLLLLGLGGHNLYRFNWLWYGAFLAIAVRCARRQAFSARNYEDFNDESVAIDPYDSPAVLLQ